MREKAFLAGFVSEAVLYNVVILTVGKFKPYSEDERLQGALLQVNGVVQTAIFAHVPGCVWLSGLFANVFA